MTDRIVSFGDSKLPARFWSKVNQDASGCWLWQATLGGGGYGRFMAAARVMRAAHRVAYEALVAPIPNGLQLDHLCRVRSCVNPNHVEPVTQAENLHRGDTITARCAAVTYCPQGHPYDDVNTYINSAGHRLCRQCARERNERFKAQNRDLHLQRHRTYSRQYRARKRTADHPDRPEWRP